MVVFYLWLVTSSYAVNMATFPNNETCVMAGTAMALHLKMPPRAVMAEVMCVPTMIIPGMPQRPPASARPGPEI